MPVELNIIESVTALDTTVVEVVLSSASEPGPAGVGVPTGGTAGQVLTKDSVTDFDTSWQDSAGGGAPTTVDYLVGTASGSLSAEIVVGTSPGGELGGTWASPTVDATHSGSSHAAVQAAAEATAAAALSAHTTDVSDAHDASAISVDSTTLVGTGTDVQAVLEELDNGIADHLADATAAHAASAISFTAGGTIAGTDVQTAVAEVATDAASALSTHEADTTSVHGITDTSALYRSGGTDVALADGGTGATLADPGADRILFWDDSAGTVTWLTAGTNLTITNTTIEASGTGGGATDDDFNSVFLMGGM